mgnify:CR=1 FL=1
MREGSTGMGLCLDPLESPGPMTSVWAPPPRVQETWTQSATQGHVQRTAVTHFQQAGPRRFLRTHWAQWQTALFRVWLEPQAEVQKASRAHPARPRASLRRWPGMATRGRLLVLMNPPALKSQVRPGWVRWEVQNDPRASGLRISLIQPRWQGWLDASPGSQWPCGHHPY